MQLPCTSNTIPTGGNTTRTGVGKERNVARLQTPYQNVQFFFSLGRTGPCKEPQSTRGNELDEKRWWHHHLWQLPRHPETKGNELPIDALHKSQSELSYVKLPEPPEEQVSVELQISLSWCQTISMTYWFRDYAIPQTSDQLSPWETHWMF